MNRDLLRVLTLVLLAFALILVGKARASEAKFGIGVVPQFEPSKLHVACWRLEVGGALRTRQSCPCV